jgi:hypothetical protein
MQRVGDTVPGAGVFPSVQEAEESTAGEGGSGTRSADTGGAALSGLGAFSSDQLLPHLAWTHIASHLPVRDLASLSGVDRNLHHLLANDLHSAGLARWVWEGAAAPGAQGASAAAPRGGVWLPELDFKLQDVQHKLDRVLQLVDSAAPGEKFTPFQRSGLLRAFCDIVLTHPEFHAPLREKLQALASPDCLGTVRQLEKQLATVNGFRQRIGHATSQAECVVLLDEVGALPPSLRAVLMKPLVGKLASVVSPLGARLALLARCLAFMDNDDVLPLLRAQVLAAVVTQYTEWDLLTPGHESDSLVRAALGSLLTLPAALGRGVLHALAQRPQTPGPDVFWNLLKRLACAGPADRAFSAHAVHGVLPLLMPMDGPARPNGLSAILQMGKTMAHHGDGRAVVLELLRCLRQLPPDQIAQALRESFRDAYWTRAAQSLLSSRELLEFLDWARLQPGVMELADFPRIYAQQLREAEPAQIAARFDETFNVLKNAARVDAQAITAMGQALERLPKVDRLPMLQRLVTCIPKAAIDELIRGVFPAQAMRAFSDCDENTRLSALDLLMTVTLSGSAFSRSLFLERIVPSIGGLPPLERSNAIAKWLVFVGMLKVEAQKYAIDEMLRLPQLSSRQRAELEAARSALPRR